LNHLSNTSNIILIPNTLQTHIKILNYQTDVRFLGVNIGNKVNIDAIWNDKINKLETTLKLWDMKNPTYEGRVFILRSQALSSIWFQAKFHELTKHKILEIERIVKNFVCKGKLKAPIKYNIMKLPRDLGGLNVPDIALSHQVLRTSWIKAYYDNTNKGDWKPLVKLIIENLIDTPGIGKDIISYPKRYPKVASKHFWTTNLRAFKSLNGFTTDDHKNTIYTPTRALSETLTTFTDNTYLMKHGLSKLSQVASINPDDGSICLHSPQTIKSGNRLNRAMRKTTWDEINAKIPKETIPPKHILTEDHKSRKILEITPSSSTEYSAITYRPRQTDESPNEDIFNLSDSPLRPFKRNKLEEEKEINTEKISSHEICLAPDPTPEGPTDNPLSRIMLCPGDVAIPLQNTELSYIYDQAIRKKLKLPHQHYAMYDALLESQPDWSKIPNRRQHQCIPAKVKDFRFLTMHNSVKLGRKLIHIPDIEPIKIQCHNCDESENNIMHMLCFCRVTQNAWNHLSDKWQALIGSYEDFVDPPDPTIHQYQKLFGIETINTNNWNKFLFQHTLDILLGASSNF
jgi:hypothetical protein